VKALVTKPAAITFAFRTNDWRFEMRFRRKLNEYRRQGIFVSHIWMYANYSGLVKSDETRKLMVLDRASGQRAHCLYGCISMAVCWDGRVTACGCADIEANALAIGNAAEESLPDIWSGTKRIGIVDSFAKGTPAKICRNCSAYLPDTSVFSRRYFRKFRPHQPLPLEFFHQFWGG
jgi:MoaA/NifB/PqqE/SkfB family radical SAM enzyme